MSFCNMIIGRFLALTLFFVLIISGTVTFSFGAVSTEDQEDIMAGCRAEQSLVFRFTYKDYVCLDPPTAERWEKLGLAEIIQNATKINQNERDNSDAVYYGAPPPAPQSKPNDASNNSECRSGYTLVHRLSYDDLYCINSSTAKLWERLGLAEIIKTEQDDVDKVKDSEDSVDESLNEIEMKSYAEVQADVVNDQPNVVSEVELDSQQIQESNIPAKTFLTLPQLHQLDKRIWVGIGYDDKNTVLIEGDTGIIIIDTLSSYEASKKVLEDFRLISDKPIKTIIYTTINPDLIEGSKAFLDEGDESVEIILDEALVENYKNVFGMNVPFTHTYSSDFSLNVSNVKINLFHDEGVYSTQTYIHLPDDKGVMIADSVNGIYPFIMPRDFFQNILD